MAGAPIIEIREPGRPVRAVTPMVLAELSPAKFDALAIANPALARRLLFDLGRIRCAPSSRPHQRRG
jgi:hypothetical protein